MKKQSDIFGTTASIVKQWRKQRGLSQAQLASEVDISTRHLSFIECGKSKPGRVTLDKIIHCLDIPALQARQLLELTGYSALDQPKAQPAEMDNQERGPDWLLDFMLDMYSPFTAFIHDQYLNFIRGNKPFESVMNNFPFTPYLFDGKTNALLTVAHPLGLRPYLRNWESVFQQMLWRFEHQSKLHPHDATFERITRELEKIPDISKLLKRKIDEEVLFGVNHIKLDFGQERLQFTRVTTDFQGPMTDGHTRHYHLIAFLPSDQKTADSCRNIARIFEDKETLNKVAQQIKKVSRPQLMA